MTKINADFFKCESIVSSDEVSDAYIIGLDKIESFIQSKDHKSMLKQILSKKDKEQIKSDALLKIDLLCTKLI